MSCLLDEEQASIKMNRVDADVSEEYAIFVFKPVTQIGGI